MLKSEYDVLQKDYTRMIERNRGLMDGESNLERERDHFKKRCEEQEDYGEKLKQELETLQKMWNEERTALNAKYADLFEYSKRVQDDSQRKVLMFRQKYSHYKSKVHEANASLKLMAQKLVSL